MEARRPPNVVVDDDVLRRDIDSDDMRRVHPDLPLDDPKKRLVHQQCCDLRAYGTIRHSLPDFTPPGGLAARLHPAARAQVMSDGWT